MTDTQLPNPFDLLVDMIVHSTYVDSWHRQTETVRTALAGGVSPLTLDGVRDAMQAKRLVLTPGVDDRDEGVYYLEAFDGEAYDRMGAIDPVMFGVPRDIVRAKWESGLDAGLREVLADSDGET